MEVIESLAESLGVATGTDDKKCRSRAGVCSTHYGTGTRIPVRNAVK